MNRQIVKKICVVRVIKENRIIDIAKYNWGGLYQGFIEYKRWQRAAITLALGVSRRRPTVFIIWQRHSKSSADSWMGKFFFFSSNCLMHRCRIPSCNMSNLPSSPGKDIQDLWLMEVAFVVKVINVKGFYICFFIQ